MPKQPKRISSSSTSLSSSRMDEKGAVSSKRCRCDENNMNINRIEDETTASDILDFIDSSKMKPDSLVSYSWEDFQECIMKHPKQVTSELLERALRKNNLIIPLEVISTMMRINRDIISDKCAQFLACAPWISLDYV